MKPNVIKLTTNQLVNNCYFLCLGFDPGPWTSLQAWGLRSKMADFIFLKPFKGRFTLLRQVMVLLHHLRLLSFNWQTTAWEIIKFNFCLISILNIFPFAFWDVKVLSAKANAESSVFVLFCCCFFFSSSVKGLSMRAVVCSGDVSRPLAVTHYFSLGSILGDILTRCPLLGRERGHSTKLSPFINDFLTMDWWTCSRWVDFVSR